MRTPPHAPGRPWHEPRDTASGPASGPASGSVPGPVSGSASGAVPEQGRHRRHPYGAGRAAARAAHAGAPSTGHAAPDLPPQEGDTVPALSRQELYLQRLREIREMSNQAIGSIDDLLQHTA
uniref:hypothetical protein n=1 Tax=Nonomuraea pusilla TaxID=46177 RepID=UPI0006E3ACCC|nr:hypothetical protein [Nonomuraea pusilla]